LKILTGPNPLVFIEFRQNPRNFVTLPAGSTRVERERERERKKNHAELVSYYTHHSSAHRVHSRAARWSEKHWVASGDGHCPPRPSSFVMRTSHPHITAPPRLTTSAPPRTTKTDPNPNPHHSQPPPAFSHLLHRNLAPSIPEIKLVDFCPFRQFQFSISLRPVGISRLAC
jgi:hypothetical protein